MDLLARTPRTGIEGRRLSQLGRPAVSQRRQPRRPGDPRQRTRSGTGSWPPSCSPPSTPIPRQARPPWPPPSSARPSPKAGAPIDPASLTRPCPPPSSIRRGLSCRPWRAACGWAAACAAWTSKAIASLRWNFPTATAPLPADEPVILAVPPWVAQELVPGLTAPDEFRAIVNGHFRLAAAAGRRAHGRRDRRHGGVDLRLPRPHLGHRQRRRPPARHRPRRPWPRSSGPTSPQSTACRATCRPGRSSRRRAPPSPPPPTRPRKRPRRPHRLANLFLAGDWTDTGLPATIEGAMRSGFRAADLALAQAAV